MGEPGMNGVGDGRAPVNGSRRASVLLSADWSNRREFCV